MENHGLRTLLDLHGQVIDQESDFFAEVDALLKEVQLK
jgi:hypothetical protein